MGKRVFWHPLHAAAVAAAAGLATAAVRRRSPLAHAVALALALRYAWICRKERFCPPHRWQWAGVVPLSFVSDLYTVAVMARASVKYRTLLL
jgi:hypothetical protein